MTLWNSKVVRAFGPLIMLSAVGAVPARASDWYVDAVTGSDSNDGESVSSAWRTITHSLQAIPSVPESEHTLHVAAGSYNAALGEVFPLYPRPLLRIVGTQGSANTILEGSTTPVLVYAADATQVYDSRSGADGLTLRQGQLGILLTCLQGDASPSFTDLSIRFMSEYGIKLSLSALPSQTSSAQPSFDRIEVWQCGVGILAQAGGNARVELDLARSVVHNSALDGIRVLTSYNGDARATLRRCRIVHNFANGILCSPSFENGAVVLDAYTTQITGNLASGVADVGAAVEHCSLRFTDCTVAHNATSGVRTLHTAYFRNSILAGNQDDLETPVAPDATWSNSEDGDLLPFPHCIAADPQFVDPENGDLRLSYGSPCIDIGDPDSADALDLLDHVRPYDGDLDALAAVDMGAYEFETLQFSGTPRPGDALHFTFWGEPGAHSRFLLSWLPLVDPSDTPYGVLYLARDHLTVLGNFTIVAPPFVFHRSLPDDPSLIGRTLSFQSLTTSLVAPQGSALTNPISFVVQP